MVVPRSPVSVCLILGQWIVELRSCAVVSECRERERKKFPPFARLPHVLDDPGNDVVVLLSRELLVQDAVVFMVHAQATKTVLGILNVPAIQQV